MYPQPAQNPPARRGAAWTKPDRIDPRMLAARTEPTMAIAQ